MFAHAYPDPDDPPITVEIEHFRVLGEQHVPLRKNSLLVIREDEAEQRLSMQSFGMPGMPGMAGSTPQMQHQFAAWLRMQQAEHTPIPDMNYFGAAATMPRPQVPAMRALCNNPSSSTMAPPNFDDGQQSFQPQTFGQTMGVGGTQGPTGGQANDGSLVPFSGASMFKPGVPKAQAAQHHRIVLQQSPLKLHSVRQQSRLRKHPSPLSSQGSRFAGI